MRTIHDVETQYRAALEGLTVREAGSDVQHRCLTDNAELRAHAWRLARGVRYCRALRRRGAASPGSESVLHAGR